MTRRPRLPDHAVLCVRDLAQAAQFYERLGFTLMPPADLPFGVRNRVAQFADNFIELLAVADERAIPPATPERFSFGAYTKQFLDAHEGMSMLALQTSDADADRQAFRADGLETYELFEFGRDATRHDGTKVRFDFSLAFATDPAMPEVVFFACQHRHPREAFWRPSYQRHPNGAARVVEVVLSASEPAAHRNYLEGAIGARATLEAGTLRVGAPGALITVLDRAGMTRRFPEFSQETGAPPRFRAYRIAVADLAATKGLLERGGIACRPGDGSIVTMGFGVAVEFSAND